MQRDKALDILLATVQAALYHERHKDEHGRAACPRTSAPAPFITVSRQAGAGGLKLAHRLAARLNEREPADRDWTVWDRELVERVAAENRIPKSLVEALEGGGPRRTWLDELALALSPSDTSRDVDEFHVYRRVAQTMRTLAVAGRVILVGRGGVYATRDLPGGVHVRLVAPFEHRVAHTAAQANVPERAAADQVRRTDREREAFHRRYWPGHALLPEIFTITLNTADVAGEDVLADCILPLIQAGRTPEPRPRSVEAAAAAAG